MMKMAAFAVCIIIIILVLSFGTIAYNIHQAVWTFNMVDGQQIKVKTIRQSYNVYGIYMIYATGTHRIGLITHIKSTLGRSEWSIDLDDGYRAQVIMKGRQLTDVATGNVVAVRV